MNIRFNFRAQVRCEHRKPIPLHSYSGIAMTALLLDSRKHGIDAAQLAIHPEETHEFNQLLEGLYADMRPNGEAQRILFGQILHAVWNLRIGRKYEARHLLEHGPVGKQLADIMRFCRTYERTYYRAVDELRTLQTEFAYRVTLARCENSATLPDVPPLVRTALVHKLVRAGTSNEPTRVKSASRSPSAGHE